MNDMFWIGARQSDVKDESIISGSITRYGNNQGNNYAFCKNSFTNSYDSFLEKTLTEILTVKPKCKFIFSNELYAYQFGYEVYAHTICLNKLSVVEALNDKMFFRQYITDVANVPPSIVINSYTDIDYNFIKSIFNGQYTDFVLQIKDSAGGEGSWLIRDNTTDQKISKLSYPILITPFLSNVLPINVHIAISNNDIRIFPPSIQIICDKLHYCGSDFFAFSYLSDKIKKDIFEQCYYVAEKIKHLGARGVFGVDILLQDNNIYFIECNFRYQGSTFVLNKGLLDNNLPSIFKIRFDCFYDELRDIPVNVYELNIAYSSFRRTLSNKFIKLPIPIDIKLDHSTPESPLCNGYISYELFDKSIYQYFPK